MRWLLACSSLVAKQAEAPCAYQTFNLAQPTSRPANLHGLQRRLVGLHAAQAGDRHCVLLRLLYLLRRQHVRLQRTLAHTVGYGNEEGMHRIQQPFP